MIRVCDAIMGSGKTSAAINYMNSHPDQHFIYVTPYLTEATRIREMCPALNFREPQKATGKGCIGKVNHTAELISAGCNVATTHSALLMYTDEMLNDIQHYGYTLFIDESVETIETFSYNREDLEIAVRAGDVSVSDDKYELQNLAYGGSLYKDIFRKMRSRDVVQSTGKSKDKLLYWMIPRELLCSFKDTFVMTYLFEGQNLYYFLKMHGIAYAKIGVVRDDGGYNFCDGPGYVPEYVSRLDSMIHILDDKRMNEVGHNRCALSVSWFNQNKSGVEQLKRNLLYYFRYTCPESTSKNRLWGSYKASEKKLAVRGCTKSFLVFNSRATNEYRDREYLAYLVNLFPNVGEKMFFRENGVELNNDLYALAHMVQWIWRSAIRDGKEIHIYIPSRRMRTILQNWIKATMEGGAIECQNVCETADSVSSDTVA